jgi:hypothetical protein
MAGFIPSRPFSNPFGVTFAIFSLLFLLSFFMLAIPVTPNCTHRFWVGSVINNKLLCPTVFACATQRIVISLDPTMKILSRGRFQLAALSAPLQRFGHDTLAAFFSFTTTIYIICKCYQKSIGKFPAGLDSKNLILYNDAS